MPATTIFPPVSAPTSPAMEWIADEWLDTFLSNDLLFLGWSPEDVASTIDDAMENRYTDEEIENHQGMKEWRDMGPVARGPIVNHIMRLLADGIYRQPSMAPRLTLAARRFFAGMSNWWPRNVTGVPVSDHSMFGTKGTIVCQCCDRVINRHEEFRIIVYGAPSFDKASFTKVPICWSCLKGAEFDTCP